MTPVNFSRELGARDDALWRIMNVIVPYSHTEYSNVLPGCPGCAGTQRLCSFLNSLISVKYSESFNTLEKNYLCRNFLHGSRVITLIRHRDWEYPFSAVLRTDDRCAPVARGASTANARNNPKQRTLLVPRLHGRVTSQPDEGRGHQSLRGRNED